MQPTSDPIALVGIAEITDLLLRITQGGVQHLTYRRDFPEPLAELIGGEVWNRDEVTAWITAHPDALAEVFSTPTA